MLSPFTVPALEGTAGPVTLNDPVFISDLHLSHSEPDTMNAFLRFLEREAAEHAELLILGDFFDYWIGDDASYTMAAVADALRAYSASHGLYIMHGNRDFMMGERFAREIGATLLRDPAVGVLRGERILLSHGDLWCTFDADYQKVRRRVRSVWWQWIMLRLPLKKRLQVAEDARARAAPASPSRPPTSPTSTNALSTRLPETSRPPSSSTDTPTVPASPRPQAASPAPSSPTGTSRRRTASAAAGLASRPIAPFYTP